MNTTEKEFIRNELVKVEKKIKHLRENPNERPNFEEIYLSQLRYRVIIKCHISRYLYIDTRTEAKIKNDKIIKEFPKWI